MGVRLGRSARDRPGGRRGWQPLLVGDEVAHVLERRSRCVTIAGCGSRARSAVLRTRPGTLSVRLSRTRTADMAQHRHAADLVLVQMASPLAGLLGWQCGELLDHHQQPWYSLRLAAAAGRGGHGGIPEGWPQDARRHRMPGGAEKRGRPTALARGGARTRGCLGLVCCRPCPAGCRVTAGWSAGDPGAEASRGPQRGGGHQRPNHRAVSLRRPARHPFRAGACRKQQRVPVPAHERGTPL